MRAELRVALRDGLAELSEEDQALLRLYALAEPYKSVAELLHMKTGSIGPTLGRSLARLRQTRALRRYLGIQSAAEHQKGGDQLELAPLDR
jgi:DNA-directed RNA polymerase specialized sigma24 family protein